MSATQCVLQYVEKMPALAIIIARELYMKNFFDMTEAAFLKSLERLSKDGKIARISKGIYCKPKMTRFGMILVGEKEIVQYFLGENNKYGFETGYKLYNKYKLTTQISKKIEIYSMKSNVAQGTVKNVNVKRLDSFYKPHMLSTIEFMEILENYHEIEDLNQKSFAAYCGYAVKEFDEKIFEQAYKKLSYKKRTIAFLKQLLDFYGIRNGLKKYLNGTSRYRTPRMEMVV
ncbi:DUF6088 family protein [Anaeromusa acidaminophila]|uniref:DUF6088 family protein n=1 Tax=Anaeromusa acidaminophila TaxID=81464 RepID=UPI00036181A1|nr:DUF6088 family protein [Anaeromusa acidaminophila]